MADDERHMSFESFYSSNPRIIDSFKSTLDTDRVLKMAGAGGVLSEPDRAIWRTGRVI